MSRLQSPPTPKTHRRSANQTTQTFTGIASAFPARPSGQRPDLQDKRPTFRTNAGFWDGSTRTDGLDCTQILHRSVGENQLKLQEGNERTDVVSGSKRNVFTQEHGQHSFVTSFIVKTAKNTRWKEALMVITGGSTLRATATQHHQHGKHGWVLHQTRSATLKLPFFVCFLFLIYVQTLLTPKNLQQSYT